MTKTINHHDYGFAAGIYEQTANGDETPVGKLMNSTPDGVHIWFKDNTRLSAQFIMQTGDGGGASIAFGDWGNGHGRSAFINDKIYAAVESNSQPSTVTVQYGDRRDSRTANTSAYLVSGGLLNPNVALCSGCDFLRWGTWGGQLKFRDGAPHGPYGSNVTADVNLGWYVAGDIATVGQIDTFAATHATAEYSGSTIGNVAAFVGNSWSTYIATGDVNMHWVFADRSGTLNIVDFDKNGPLGALNLSGTMIAPGQLAPNDLNRFNGPLLGTLGSASAAGAANGAFVNAGADIAKGSIGNWNAISGNNNYQATGIFGMSRH